jgi:hypothetical protein
MVTSVIEPTEIMDAAEVRAFERAGSHAPEAALSVRMPLLAQLSRDERLQREFELGRQAQLTGEARRRGQNDGDVPVVQQVARERALLRKGALEKLLPPKRKACAEGLSVLYPTQYPLELQAWLDDPHARTLILAGPTGNGKSQAAFATAAQAARYGAMMWDAQAGEAVRKPLLVRGWTVNNYLRELLPDGSPEPVWKTRHMAIWAELLIQDDLGAELDQKGTEWMRKEVADLLDERLERNGRQIYTTNQPAAIVKDRLGDRLWSRIQEDATVLRFEGPDLRAMKELTW